jgi:hypothetical protein
MFGRASLWRWVGFPVLTLVATIIEEVNFLSRPGELTFFNAFWGSATVILSIGVFVALGIWIGSLEARKQRKRSH